VRQNFEDVVDDLERKALGALAAIRRHHKTHGESRPDIITDICARAGTHLREVLGKANDLVKLCSRRAGQFRAAPEASGLASLSASNLTATRLGV
jgi:hypothetical protein